MHVVVLHIVGPPEIRSPKEEERPLLESSNSRGTLSKERNRDKEISVA